MKRMISKTLMAGFLLASSVALVNGASAATKPVVPVLKNPIANSSTTPGITISSAMVQDNVDAKTKKAIPDMLFLKVNNKSTKPATGFEIFYTMKDSVTKASESYYQKLTGFKVKAGSARYLYFDGKSGLGHFPENKFSIYRSSINEVKFAIVLSANGFKIATAAATKDKGTGEKVD